MRIQTTSLNLPTSPGTPRNRQAESTKDVVQLGHPTGEAVSRESNRINNFLKLAGVAGTAGLAAMTLPSLASAAEAGGPATAAAATGASTAMGVLQTVLPLAGLGLMGFMAYRMFKQGGESDGGKAEDSKVVKSDKTFADVAGIPEAKEELMFTVDFMKNPEKFAKLGAKVPRGVLLSGPPGCGKTLLAKATAGEAGVNFLQCTGSDFVEKYVGVGARRVRDLFEEAKKNMPCIVFIDEIDAIGAQRTGGGDGNREADQTLNALLTQMDGFNTKDGIIVMGATNRPEMLDAALIRSGRFDSKVTVNPPNRDGRRQILDVHAKGKPLADQKDLDIVADRTTGMVGADLENIMNKAATEAARKGAEEIDLANLSEAIDTVAMGPQAKSRKLDEFEKKVTAYHEAGHATVAKALPSNGILMKVSILPRGPAAGVCWTNPVDNKSMYSRQDLEDHICKLLGGAAGEELKIGKNFTGPSNDIERATEAAMSMVMSYGMEAGLGKVKYTDLRSRDKGLAPSQETQHEIDAAVQKIMDTQWQRAKAILVKNDEKYTNLAETLIQKEELDRPELEQLMQGVSA